MDDVFDILSSLCTDGDENAQQAAKLIALARQAGVLDPRQPVGSHALPLVHSLAKDKILGVSWLEIFDEPGDPFGLYESFSGSSLGTYLLKDPSTWESWKRDRFLDTFQWWLDKKGAPSQSDASMWGSSLEVLCNDYLVGDRVTSLVNHLLAVQDPKSEASNPLHPKMRWASSVSCWCYFKENGQLDDIVRCPSGQHRTLLDSIFLSNLGNNKFNHWLSSLPGITPLALPEADHSRSKELVHKWALDGSIDQDLACLRLAAAIKKTEHAWMIVFREVGKSSRIGELLGHRDATGFSIKDWFFAQMQSDLVWPDWVESLDNGRTQGMFPAIARANLLTHSPRGLANMCDPKKLGERFQEPGKLSKENEQLLFGSQQERVQMVDLLVDAIIHPNNASVAAISLAKQVLRLGTPEMLPGYDKLLQASNLARIWSCASSLKMLASFGSSGNGAKLIEREKRRNNMVESVRQVITDVLLQGPLLCLTRDEWEQLCKKKGISHLPRKEFSELNEMFMRHGQAVEIDGATGQIASPSSPRRPSRL